MLQAVVEQARLQAHLVAVHLLGIDELFARFADDRRAALETLGPGEIGHQPFLRPVLEAQLRREIAPVFLTHPRIAERRRNRRRLRRSRSGLETDDLTLLPAVAGAGLHRERFRDVIGRVAEHGPGFHIHGSVENRAHVARIAAEKRNRIEAQMIFDPDVLVEVIGGDEPVQPVRFVVELQLLR